MKLSKTYVSLSNLDLHYLVREFKPLEGQYLQKVYGEGKTFRLKFRTADVVIQLPEKAYLAKNPPVFEEHPSSFVMLLRKHLAGKLVKVSQLNFDRILRFDFEKSSLVFELFAGGNLILLTTDGKIIRPLLNQEFSSRIVKQGQVYVAPPMEKRHPAEMEAQDWLGLKGKVVSALSKRVNFAPFYLEEACVRAGVPLDAAIETLTLGQKTAIEDALKKMMDDYAPHKYGGIASPIRLEKLPAGQAAPTYSELIETQPVLIEEEKTSKNFLQATQAKAMGEFREKEILSSQRAQWLSANVGLVQSILDGDDEAAQKAGIKVTRKGFQAEIEVPETVS